MFEVGQCLKTDNKVSHDGMLTKTMWGSIGREKIEDTSLSDSQKSA